MSKRKEIATLGRSHFRFNKKKNIPIICNLPYTIRWCLQTLHKHLDPSQFFIFILNSLSLELDFICSGREFQIFGPNDFRLLDPKETWLGFGTAKSYGYLGECLFFGS